MLSTGGILNAMKQEKEFDGELQYLESYRIIPEGKDDKIADFFLVLAEVFNDFKGIDFFEKLIINQYRFPPPQEVSVHQGEYSGLLTQTRKIFIGNLREFLEFLKENKEILQTTEFRDVLDKTNKDIQRRWKNIVDIALERESEDIHNFTKYLKEVRNNVASHYYQPKGLRIAFCNFFHKKRKIEQNKLAYYYIGETMETTRFFYADAAVQEYLRSTTQQNEIGFDYKYKTEIGAILGDVSLTILRLLKAYLKNRPK